ncbi:hypothetical protein KBI51_05070 [Aerococcaceae bacterium zg-ZUI334]|uniref:leucine-rich repeat domain-containing protein n=1 Tax=Aerococcaceae bacterium zg-252 TaxID=2796928 RepID=UPI001BA08901|nr:hypothetical protein [Aerococcaceae bacterium zg-ZUI334]
MKIRRSILISASAILLASYTSQAVFATANMRTVDDIKQELVHFEDKEDVLIYQIKKGDELEQIAKVLNIDADVLKAINTRVEDRLTLLGTFITLVEERYVIVADAFYHDAVVFDLNTPDEETHESFSKIKPTEELKNLIDELHEHYHSHGHHDHDHGHEGHHHDHDHGHEGHHHDHDHGHEGHNHSHDHADEGHSHDHGHEGHHHDHDHSHEGHSHDHGHEGHNHSHDHADEKHSHDHEHSHDGHEDSGHEHHEGHNHDDLKVGMEALEKMGIDHEIVHALVHADSTIPFPANETDPVKLKEYLASVKSINIGEIANPLTRKGLELIPNIEVLGIGFTKIDDVTPVLQFKNLKQLWMTATGIKNYDFLHQFKYLEGVDISQNDLESIEFLRDFPDLKVVAAAGNNLTNDKVEVLKSLLKLEGLNLDYNELTSLDFLKEHQNLRLLSVEHNHLTSLEGVNSAQLEGVYASHNHISDLAPLANKEKLESVVASDNEIASLATLTNVPNLGQLNVDNNKLTSDSDIKRLEAENVNVSAENNPVSEMAEVANETTTTELSAEMTPTETSESEKVVEEEVTTPVVENE